MEQRTLFGIQMEQKRNDAIIDANMFSKDKIIVDSGEVIKFNIFKFNFSQFFFVY